MIVWPWVIITLAVSMIGIAKSGFGGGLGLIVVPITTLALPYAGNYAGDDALGLLLPLLIVGDIIAVWQYRREVSWPTIRRLLPGAFLGVLLGTGLIWLLKQHASIAAALINLEIGFESILLVAMSWYRQWHGKQQRLVPEPWRALGTGTFAGTSSTLAHAAGPIIAMYLLPLNLGRLQMVATSATFFFIANSAKLPTYWFAGNFEKISVPFALCFFPAVLAGAIFGRWLTKKMSDRVFIQIVYATVFILGVYLFGKGLAGII
ncbi:MAG: sulfite exporter TauE/SafE family protein [Tepidisphaeraceae bacterium]